MRSLKKVFVLALLGVIIPWTVYFTLGGTVGFKLQSITLSGIASFITDGGPSWTVRAQPEGKGATYQTRGADDSSKYTIHTFASSVWGIILPQFTQHWMLHEYIAYIIHGTAVLVATTPYQLIHVALF
jgi:hypothetical protein